MRIDLFKVVSRGFMIILFNPLIHHNFVSNIKNSIQNVSDGWMVGYINDFQLVFAQNPDWLN